MNDNKIRALIEARRSGKPVAAVNFVANNPEIPAVLSKLVTSLYPTATDPSGNRRIDTIDQASMRDASADISQKSRDADLVMELFPEMELSAQILISSIISPKDMNSTEVIFGLPANLKVSPLSSLLMPIIKEHFEGAYKIEPLLPRILKEVLFGSGSYAVAVLPENSIDELINGEGSISTESLTSFVDNKGTFRPLGILGPSKIESKEHGANFSLESFSELKSYNVDAKRGGIVGVEFVDDLSSTRKNIQIPGLFVTDNFNGLKMPKLIARARDQATEHILATESYGLSGLYQGWSGDGLNDQQLSGLFYKNRTTRITNVVKVKTDDETKRKMIGEPLILKLPSESVIPVYTPGKEEDHIGYFVLIDSEGNPVSRNSVEGQEKDLRSRLNQNSDMNSYLLNKASKTYSTNCDSVTFRQASKVYSDIVEADLLARLRNGIVGPVVSIANNEEIYRIMLARTLMKQNTQLMYIPKKLVTYFATEYNAYGVGQSLLDKMRNLNSLRAMLLFAKTMAQVKNSIGRTRVNLKLDPNDPNPQKAIEIAMHEVARTRQQGLPLGINSAGDLVDWVQKSGLEYAFEGHPGLPDMSLEFSEHSTNYTEPSNELSEDLRKSAIMAVGLSPETVDAGFQSEFATSVVANNLLLSKRVKKIQEIFVPQITDHCRKVALHNAYVVDLVKSTINDNLDKIIEASEKDPIISQYKETNKTLLVHLLSLEFLSNFEITLSQPDTVVLKNQLEAFDTQEQLVSKAIEYFVSNTFLPGAFTGEQAAERVNEVKEVVKAHLMRQWMQQNNVLPELNMLGQTDEEGQPVVSFGETYKSFINGMVKSVVDLMQSTVPVGQAADKDIEKLSGGEDLGDASTASSSTGGDIVTDSGSDDLSGFGGSDDALGGDDDLPDLDSLS